MASENERDTKKSIVKIKKNSTTCEFCSIPLENKTAIRQHKGKCITRRTCKWCNLVFRSHGNLVTHEYYVHGNKSVKNENDLIFKCTVCEERFKGPSHLKHHIRRSHFNFQAKIPLFEMKKDNDVWLEKVLNNDIIVQIHKINDFKLSIERYKSDNMEKVEQSETDVGVAGLYTTKLRNERIHCSICNINMLKRVYKKHYDEQHTDMAKHVCNNCNATFKRSCSFIRHVCNKSKKKRKRRKIGKIARHL